MPADCHAGDISGEKGVNESVRRDAGRQRHSIKNKAEEGWKRRGALELAILEIVVITKRGHAAVSEKASEFEWLEIHRAHLFMCCASSSIEMISGQ
jgi:hypothetical protein